MAHRFGWIRARHRGCGCGSGPRVFFCYFRPGTLRGELAPQCPRPPLYRGTTPSAANDRVLRVLSCGSERGGAE